MSCFMVEFVVITFLGIFILSMPRNTDVSQTLLNCVSGLCVYHDTPAPQNARSACREVHE
jgi:hypothetical protein